MKNIRYLLIAVITIAIYSCNKSDEIGYLFTDGAGYLPDSLVMRAIPDPVIDKNRVKYKTPWFSTEIQGIDGTAPITYEIVEAKTTDGNQQSILDNIEVKGIGVLYIPYENTVSPGRYSLTLKVSNCNGDQFLEDAFTLIVE